MCDNHRNEWLTSGAHLLIPNPAPPPPRKSPPFRVRAAGGYQRSDMNGVSHHYVGQEVDEDVVTFLRQNTTRTRLKHCIEAFIHAI